MEKDLADVFAENLNWLFADQGITSAARGEVVLRVPKSTIDRAWNNRASTRLETVRDLAAGLRVQPWMLLVPELNPRQLPRLESQAAQDGIPPARDVAARRSIQGAGRAGTASTVPEIERAGPRHAADQGGTAASDQS